jgi:lipopolysaccharide export system protein LptA
MKLKHFLIFPFFCFTVLSGFAQQKISFRAEWQYHDDENFPGIEKFVGNVVFTQDNTIGYCDSAYSYINENYTVAYGNPVRIYINDTITLTGDQVIYNGNTKITTITGKVILKDNNSALYTDNLTYDINYDYGYYPTWGKMINNEDTLTSNTGYYYTKEKIVYLKGNVILVNDSYTMNCDSLRYNTQNEVVYFISPTQLISEDNVINTKSGWYDTKNDNALLVDEVELNNKDQKLTGDSLYYDRNKKFGIGWNNIVLTDTVKGYVVKGNYLEYAELGGHSMTTDSALLIMIDQTDSLFLHADTLRLLFDTLQNPLEIYAFNHAKYFNKDMQGACDSMVYMITDSTLTMYFNPVLWSGENQLTADTIRFTIIDSINTRLELCKSGYIVSSLFENTEFNQIKGTHIVGYIKNNKLEQVEVINNAECIYYIVDEDTALIGINVSLTSEMRLVFDNNKIQRIHYYNKPDGKIFADGDLKKEDRLLKDFRWLDFYRPKEILDIFKNPIPRTKLEPQPETISNTNR